MPARINIKYEKDGNEEEVKMDVHPKHRMKDLLSPVLDLWEDEEDADDFVFLKDGDPIDPSSTIQEEGIVKDDTLILKSKASLQSSKSRAKRQTQDRTTTREKPTEQKRNKKRRDETRPSTGMDEQKPPIKNDEDVKLWIEDEVGVSKRFLEFTSKEKLDADKNRYELKDDSGHKFEIVTEGETVVYYRPIISS